jgi:hypothetical protein
MGNIKQQIGIVAFVGKHFSANKRQMTQRPDALTPDRHIKPTAHLLRDRASKEARQKPYWR